MSQSPRARAFREREVLTQLSSSRWVSMFWLSSPATRMEALMRMEARGVLTAHVMEYPMYRVVIHKRAKRPCGEVAK